MKYETISNDADILRRKISKTVAMMTLAMAILVLLTGSALAQTTTFTYQGRFTDGGTAANGTYEMQFKLFDGPTPGSGSQIGSTITNGAVALSGGVFTVQLDFGNAGFSGADRFLEIGVRPSGSSDPFTVLAPRQQLTSAVYAIRAGSTASADSATNATQLGGVAASQYVQANDSRLSDSRTPTAGSSAYIQNTTSQQAADFNITGSGNAGGVLSATIVNSATQYNLSGNRVVSIAGSANTFVGVNTSSVNTGFSNSFFGNSAGATNTQGSSNSFFGERAGTLNTAGSANAFFGSATGVANTTGGANAFFGTSAGSSNTTGSDNAYFGAQAGFVNITGSGNSFFGRSAGANAFGDTNSFFGFQTGQASIGSSNSFFGYQAGQSNQQSYNSFFGALAGAANTDGDSDSFFGNVAGFSNTGGSSNSFFGQGAGFSNTMGHYNTFVGDQAGRLNVEGQRNSFFGRAAGAGNNHGRDNSYVGVEAGYNTTIGIGNTFIGIFAGHDNSTGDSNTMLGSYANVGAPSLSYATAIGSEATVATSNTIVLGRSNGLDAVRVPGSLTVSTLGTAGSTSLCRNAAGQISTCSSSLRYKNAVRPFTHGLALLNQLRPITFNWKADNSADLGFGAEDIAAIEPLLVTHNEQGEVEGVKYDRITAVLVNAVKEQQQQIEQQQLQIREQQRTVANLKRLVCGRNRHTAVCKH